MPEGTKISKHFVCACFMILDHLSRKSAIPKRSWMNMKPLVDLFLKSKFIPLSCRTKSAMHLTETVSHTSSLSSGFSCQYQKKKKSTLRTARVWWQKQCDLSLNSVYLFLSRTSKHSLDTINTHICSPLLCYSQLLIMLNWIWPLLWTQAEVNSNLMLVTLTEAGLLFYMHLCQVRKLSERRLTSTSIERTKSH